MKLLKPCFREGDKADSYFILLDGHLRSVKKNADENERIRLRKEFKKKANERIRLKEEYEKNANKNKGLMKKFKKNANKKRLIKEYKQNVYESIRLKIEFKNNADKKRLIKEFKKFDVFGRELSEMDTTVFATRESIVAKIQKFNSIDKKFNNRYLVEEFGEVSTENT